MHRTVCPARLKDEFVSTSAGRLLRPGRSENGNGTTTTSHCLARICHHLTAEARHRPAMTSLRLLAVLNVGFNYAALFRKLGAEQRAPCTDRPLTHFASPRGEKSGLEITERLFVLRRCPLT